VIAVLAAAVMFGITWRIDLVSGIGVLVLALPYPRGTVFGSTNLALVLLLVVIWLLRRRCARPRCRIGRRWTSRSWRCSCPSRLPFTTSRIGPR